MTENAFNKVLTSLRAIAALEEDGHVEKDLEAAIDLLEKGEETLLFYAYGFRPCTVGESFHGFTWKPKDYILEDSGMKALKCLKGGL